MGYTAGPNFFPEEPRKNRWNCMPLQPLHIYLTQIPMPKRLEKFNHPLTGRIERFQHHLQHCQRFEWSLRIAGHHLHHFYPYAGRDLVHPHTNELWTTSYSLYNLVRSNEKYPTCLSKALQTRRVKNIHQSTLKGSRKQKHLLISWPKKKVEYELGLQKEGRIEVLGF